METLVHLTSSNGKKLMLRITTQKKRGKTLLSIEGRLAGPLVGTLEQCWRELRAAAPGEKLHLNLCGVSFIDAAGKMLLKEIHRQGGELIARSEEHTSELQSRLHLVCRLLLEKKNNSNIRSLKSFVASLAQCTSSTQAR